MITDHDTAGCRGGARRARSFGAGPCLCSPVHRAVKLRRAEERFLYTDPSGDALGGVASSDIVSVSYQVRAGVPSGERDVVIEMVLAKTPSDAFDYQTVARTGDCGYLNTAYAPPAVLTMAPGTSRSNIYASWCSDTPSGTEVATMHIVSTVHVTGRVITWSVPISDLPATVRHSTFTDVFAFTQVAEPVLGHIGNGGGPTSNDWAKGRGGWALE